jgi:hypothetical protein
MITLSRFRTVAPGITLLIVSLGAFAQNSTSPQPPTPQNLPNLQALLDAQRAAQARNDSICEQLAQFGFDEKLCKASPGIAGMEGGRRIWVQQAVLNLKNSKDPALQAKALDLERQYKVNLMMFGTQEERAAIWAGAFGEFMHSQAAKRLGLGLVGAGIAYEFWLRNYSESNPSLNDILKGASPQKK